MSFIQRELDRIASALRSPQSADRYCQLYAAQQALSWALDPTGFATPSDTVAKGITGIQEDLAGYSVRLHQPLS